MGKNWVAGEKQYTGTGTVSGTAGAYSLIGSGTDWPHNLTPGMGILVDTDGDDVYETEFTISYIPSAELITTEEAVSSSFSGKNFLYAQVAYEPDYGDVGSSITEMCATCAKPYPVSELAKINGAYYCRARGHDREIMEVQDRGKKLQQGVGFVVRME